MKSYTKKTIKRLFSLLLTAIVACMTLSVSVFADTIDMDKDLSAQEGLYIGTKECPEGYITYAKENVGRYLASVEPGEIPENSTLTVGNPFCFANPDSDIYYFPILCDNEVIYTYRVGKTSEGYAGVLSKGLTEELNAAAAETSPENPLFIRSEGDDIVTYIGEKREVVFSYPAGTFEVEEEIGEFNAAETAAACVVNAKQKSAAVDYETTAAELNVAVDNISAIPSSKQLSLSIVETQSGTNWCAAYVTAAIVRYVRGVSDAPLAYNVMSAFYIDAADSDSLSHSQVVTYGKACQLNPICKEAQVSATTLQNEIANNRPVYLGMKDSGGSHAVVLNGYDKNQNSWIIWNPWYRFYEIVDIYGTYIPQNSQSISYKYYATIYNWG